MNSTQVAVVTGAASGLGFGLALALAERGMGVVIADIDADGLERAQQQLLAKGADILAVPTDVTKESAVASLADRAFERFGHVDVVCLNAGVAMRGPAWKLSNEDWRWVYDVNVFGVVYGISSFVPALLERNIGHVLITGSNSAVSTLAGRAPYVSSKHAVLSIAETLQHDLRGAGSDVRVSIALPGAIRSAMADTARNRPPEYGHVEVPAEVLSASRDFLNRFGADPHEMADDILRKALDEHQFCIFTESDDVSTLSARTDALRDGRLPDVSAFVTKEVG